MNNFNEENYLTTARAIAKEPKTGMLPFHAEFTWQEGLLGSVKVRDFKPLLLDEPKDLGGTNKGPNPVEYLMSGIAGCFSLGVVIGASLQNITIQSIKTEADANLDMGVFFDAVRGGRHGIGDVTLKLHIKADATDEQLNTLIQHSLEYSPVLNSLNISVKSVVVRD